MPFFLADQKGCGSGGGGDGVPAAVCAVLCLTRGGHGRCLGAARLTDAATRAAQEIWALRRLAALAPACAGAYAQLLDCFDCHGHTVLVRRLSLWCETSDRRSQLYVSIDFIPCQL